MIDDRTAHRLLDHIACGVIGGMRDGKTLEEIDGKLFYLRKVDRIALYEHMVGLVVDDEERDAIVAHLRTLKRRKRLPQPTSSPATILPFRPEDRPT
jgi:hypothetical protein